MYRIENSFRLNASINVSVEKTIFKNRPIREVRAIFWEDMTHTRKSIHKEKVLSIFEFYNQRGGGGVPCPKCLWF